MKRPKRRRPSQASLESLALLDNLEQLDHLKRSLPAPRRPRGNAPRRHTTAAQTTPCGFAPSKLWQNLPKLRCSGGGADFCSFAPMRGPSRISLRRIGDGHRLAQNFGVLLHADLSLRRTVYQISVRRVKPLAKDFYRFYICAISTETWPNNAHINHTVGVCPHLRTAYAARIERHLAKWAPFTRPVRIAVARPVRTAVAQLGVV